VHYAVKPSLIERVTGYADTKPFAVEEPETEANQRITLSLTLSAKAKFKDGQVVEKRMTGAAPPAPADLRPES
jgi:chemotaxis protein MotB